MIVTVLDPSLVELIVIEKYYSLLWPEQYNELSNWTMELPIEYMFNSAISIGNFISIKASERAMVIENLYPMFDEENGSKLVVEGASAEVLLEGRTLDDVWVINGSIELAIGNLFIDNFMTPGSPDRSIPNMTFELSGDSDLAAITYTNVFEADNLYTLIMTVCKAVDVGFKIVLDNDQFILKLYLGVDRSYDQVDRPPVVFSENYDNLRSGSYYVTAGGERNVALVVTSDPTYPKVTAYETVSEPEGYHRKEVYVDATDVSRTVPDAPDLTDQEFLAIVIQRGLDAINDSKSTGVFDGDVDIESSFVIGTHFNMGDILQCEIGPLLTQARMTELVRSISNEGVTTHASFNFNL